MAINAGAQTVSDALRFGENNYYGTARSIAMGNAFTALGGDLGSITINPAGSAVNSFSQIAFTPNVSILTSSAQYNAMPSTGTFGSTYKENKAQFSVPNFGAVINFKTGRRSGLKNVALGLVANATANYIDNLYASGRNTSSTYAGYLAAASEGYNSSSITSDAYYNSNIPWQTIVGWQSGIISNYGTRPESEYLGITEKATSTGNDSYDIQLADAIDQHYGRQAHGNKYDIAVNVGFNFSDKFYAGGSIGIASIKYSMDEYFKEYAVNKDSFAIDFADNSGNTTTTYFNSLRSRYAYDADASGIFGKFGVIYTPIQGLRLGAAIQTPTANFVTEHWELAGETYFDNSNFNASAQSPRGEYKYKHVSPARYSFGVAYTFGQYGLVSADYEVCDYSTMKFKETDTNDNSAFGSVNADIKDFTGASHMLRLGLEIKPISQFAIRAGYNLTTSGERTLEDKAGNPAYAYYDNMGRYYTDYNGNEISGSEVEKVAVKAYRHAFSLGAGYSSKKSFFCDLALRYTKYPYEYIYPYSNYLSDADSPEIKNRRGIFDVVATFGWRF